MTIHYEVTVQDYINFNLYHMETSKSGKRLHILMFRVAPLLFILISFARFITLRQRINAGEISTYLTGLIVITVMGVLVYFLFLKLIYTPSIKWYVKLALKDGKSNDFIGPQTITLHDDYIEDTNAHMTTRINYSSVEKLCRGYNCLFIYIGAVKGIIIPLRSFSDSIQKEKFATILKQKTGLNRT